MDERDVHLARLLYGEHSFNKHFLRSYEPKVLVHSTPSENVNDILFDRELKCWNILNKEKINWETNPIGALLGDIGDFSNYIMFSDIKFNSEIIVASKQKQKIDINTEQIYMPGARFYFDAEKIAREH
jgi:hypothetical protein